MDSAKLEVKKVLEIGLAMEIAARDFYRKAAAGSKHPGTRQMLEELAEEEERHLTMFKAALRGEDVDFGAEAPAPGQDLKLGETLTQPTLEAGSDSADALVVAINAEMQAITFYSDSARALEGTPAAKMLWGLVEEEKAHKARLERLYDDEYLQQN